MHIARIVAYDGSIALNGSEFRLRSHKNSPLSYVWQLVE